MTTAVAGTLDLVVPDINYGPRTPGDDELRLCGEVADGKRAIELGISPWFNSIAFARAWRAVRALSERSA